MGGFIQFEQDFLERLRQDADLSTLIGRDVQLRRVGDGFLGRCPFHEERTPSFHVSISRNTYHCFGCHAHGDAIAWMRSWHRLSFRDAVVALARESGVALPSVTTTADSDESKARRKRLAALYQALAVAARIYSRALSRDAVAQAYLTQKRGLTADTIQRFGLGVVGKGIVGLLAKTTDQAALLDCGLAIKRDEADIFDRFRHRIMVPIHNESGHLVGFAGRTMIENPEKAPKYLNGPETEIFHKGRELYGLNQAKTAIRASGLAIVVEGYFDVLSLHQAGDARAVAPMGTALSGPQVRRLLIHADTVVFAFDADRAGIRAALAAAMVLLVEIPDGKTARFLFLPDGEDPDSFVRAHGLEAWQSRIDQALPLSAYLCGHISDGLNRELPESQVAAAGKAKDILSRIQRAELFRRAMRAKFEEIIGVSLD
ncbi:DNA primase [Burkholderia diffusa]|uniref:DNA primase n=1 Tax=Burkholderia diffusa TaxID=488732 RepID=UPI001CAB2B20|nr:DNA primase [Burkholderia diffusa]CAG9260958.1 DNA primase [Burkholderia diffusa]